MALANDPTKRIHYPTYKSPYGPKTGPAFERVEDVTLGEKRRRVPSHGNGAICATARANGADLCRTGTTTNPSGMKSAAFGGVAFFGVVYYASGIPRVQRDILQKLPIIGKNFVHEVPASDNPF
ncbi:hypothetical protein DL764_007027 [Monosporascus ibericus]|uniref:Uncharacterized protein n=1 Tax=Monosporascus ibericus TaxID=155417 RepID=A0A4V1X9X0_9PEZI|nr:hypothetical protein DL764_007027 [Monosporascus ibericus]